MKNGGFSAFKDTRYKDTRGKQDTMTNTPNSNSNNGKYDLEERTTDFAKRVVRLCRALQKNTINNRLIDQVIRSAGSVGANYREANDALGKKDFVHRLKISRKEAKETLHWLELIEEANPGLTSKMSELKQENIELKNIFSSIIDKVSQKK